jgi:uncharacterized BrkB/YihY/UPF0761 family membrane protein
MSSRRVATARPPPGGATRSLGHGAQIGLRSRELARALRDGFELHDLLTYSSAISFQILTAVVPFERIYGATAERAFFRRYLISFALAFVTGACSILAALSLVLAPFFAVRHPGAAWDVFAFLTRWVLAVGFLSIAVGLLVHVAPATSQPLPWVSLGTAIVIVWWVTVSVGFYFYLTTLASYGSVFGSLASVIVVMAYLYISTTAFLFGAQLDAIIRAQATGTLSGAELEPLHHS